MKVGDTVVVTGYSRGESSSRWEMLRWIGFITGVGNESVSVAFPDKEDYQGCHDAPDYGGFGMYGDKRIYRNIFKEHLKVVEKRKPKLDPEIEKLFV